MLRVDPRQRARLVEIAQNLQDRIAEARLNGWLGEVQGLQVSLEAARSKLANLDCSTIRGTAGGPTDLGMPVLAVDVIPSVKRYGRTPMSQQPGDAVENAATTPAR